MITWKVALDWGIPTLVLLYIAFLVLSMIRKRARGERGGCSGCPYAKGCGARTKARKRPKNP